MAARLSAEVMIRDQNQRIAETYAREQRRLRGFIRRYVADERDVEDIFQDVFSELVEAYRLLKPVELVTAWLFRVAKNRIVDRFRRKRPEVSTEEPVPGLGDDEAVAIGDLLPSLDGGPDASYARAVLLEELEAGLEELPREQRDVFIAHELEGRSFKEIAEETGIGVNTLLSRKHYAVQHLRHRLRAIHDEILKERG